MSQSPISVTYSLEEILKEINGKLDTLQKDVNDLKIGQARLEENLIGINKHLDNQEFINRSVGIGFILAFVTGIIKLFYRRVKRAS